MIECIKEFMKGCPYIDEGRININCLGARPVCYSIDQVAENSVIKKYCDGGALKQYSFIFAMRDAYDENPKLNEKTAEHFEKICEWIFEQNSIRNLPKPKDIKIIPERIEVSSKPQLYDSSLDSVRMQMEIRFVYRQEC